MPGLEEQDMDNPIIEKLLELIDEGKEIDAEPFAVRWGQGVQVFIDEILGEEAGAKFWDIKGDTFDKLAQQIALMEALVLKIKMSDYSKSFSLPIERATAENINTQIETAERSITNKNVFIVHGHDNEAKETIARFIEKLGLDPIILHEQPNSGRIIIEKFEMYADVPFALVLLTPDDEGRSKDDKEYKLRARQNVVLELGYFMGKIGRDRVCALYTEGVEIPSDYQGVLYVKLDQEGAWKNKIATEFVEANLPIKIERLLK